MGLLTQALAGRKVVLTSGSYDLFHSLHLVFLERCRRLCDVLIVGVDSDDSIRERKGPQRPLIPEHQRVAIVGALACVDGAFVLGSVEGFEEAMRLLKPMVIFKNKDFKEEEVLGRDRARVVIVPDLIQHSSTSGIVEEVARRMTSAKGTASER